MQNKNDNKIKNNDLNLNLNTDPGTNNNNPVSRFAKLCSYAVIIFFLLFGVC
jgi:hypothetical protein